MEKRVTERMLEDGRLTLSTGELLSVGLPEHSGIIEVEFADEEISAQWSSTGRYVHGDAFAERLQEYCQINSLIRMTLVGTTWRIQPVGSATTSLTSHRWQPPSQPVSQQPTKKRPVKRPRPERVFRTDKEFDWSDDKTIGFLRAARTSISSNMREGGFDSRAMVHLRMEGERLATIDGYEELYAIDVANVEHMPHQEAVARQVLAKMRGRAVLADEVGLGKTIEAGLVVKELAIRGVAKRILIICPATLREQWKHEMDEKFELSFDVAYSRSELANQSQLILSLQLAARNSDLLTHQPWDVVIVDEAHRAAGAGATKTREAIDQLTRSARHVLLLTATPVQNDLLELYRLVELLRPGTLGSVRTFKSNFVDTRNPRNPVNPADLRRLVSSAMIRTTRAQAGVDRVKRRPVDYPIRLGKAEQELYLLATDLLRSVMTDSSDTMRRRLLAQRLAGSPYSMGTTALRMAQSHPDPRAAKVLGEIAHRAMDIKKSAREDAALKLTSKWLEEHGRVLMFTQHTDTVQALLRRFEAEGIEVVPFHGGLSAGQRTEAIGAFRSGKARILLSTDAGAEGQNLQFCNCVINYDLPWNPMRIEQRIGRVDRLTQPRDEVFVANLFAKDTIDEHVYRLLHDKLRMFELLFGQVTTILGELDGAKDLTFEGRVMEALFAQDDQRMSSILEALGTDLDQARQKGQEMAGADQGLSEWLVGAKQHRSGLTTRGADELLPDQSRPKSTRQDSVQTWTRRAISELGGTVVHDSEDELVGFVSAEFPEELADELGGRSRLHLAFNRSGLAEHPESELCTAGSPTFTDLLGLLRERGDVHFAITDPGAPNASTPTAHDDAIERVSFELVPDLEFSGSASFRAETGDTELIERIVVAEIGPPKGDRLPKRSLRESEHLHQSIDVQRHVIQAFEEVAVDLAESLRREHENELHAAIEQERARVVERYRTEFGDYGLPSMTALARDAELKRLSKPPKVKASRRNSTYEIEWGEDPSGGPGIDFGGCEPPDELLAIDVVAETELKTGALLARLRRDVPPPRPPTITMVRVEVLEEHGFDARGAFRRVTATESNGQPVQRNVRSARWTFTDEHDALTTGIVASAELDELPVTVHRVNSSLRVDFSHPSGTSGFHCSESALDFNIESSWHEMLVEAGVPGGRLCIVDRGQPGPTDFLHPSRPVLAEREIEEWWEVAPISDGIDDTRALRADDVHNVDVAHYDAGSALSSIGDVLRGRLIAMADNSATHVLLPRAAARDTWADRGTVHLEYDVIVGEQPDVELEDAGVVSNDFEICSRNHVHRPRAEKQCAVCQQWLCLACDPTGPLHVCICGRSACVSCTTADHDLTPLVCGSCESADCDTCGTRVVRSSCGVCERVLCLNCDVGGRCVACRSIEQASLHEIGELPKALAAAGASVSIGRDTGAAVVLLVTPERRELVVIVGGHISRWISLSPSEPEHRSRFRLGMSQRLGKAIQMETTEVMGWEPPADHLQIQRSVERVSAIREAGGAWQVVARDLEAALADPLPIVNASLFFDQLQIPAHSDRQVQVAWPSEAGAGSAVTTVGCAVYDETKITALCPNGLVRVHSTADGITTETASWQAVESEYHRVDTDWEPSATVLSLASMEPFRSWVVRHGSSKALAVAAGSDVDWFELCPRPMSCESALLEQLLASSHPIGGVDEWTAKTAISFPTVMSASLVSRSITPSMRLAADSSAESLRGVRLEWFPDAEAHTPLLATLPSELLAQLRQRFEPVRTASISLGARVRDVWLDIDGRSVELTFDVAPGEQTGYIVDHETGRPISAARLDSEGHLVEAPVRCEYCGTSSCGACVNRSGPCPCCGISLCRRCATSDPIGLCQACRSLRQPTRVELVRMGRWKRSLLLVGADPLHSVRLEHGDQWTASSTDRADIATNRPVDESVAQEINRRAARETSSTS